MQRRHKCVRPVAVQYYANGQPFAYWDGNGFHYQHQDLVGTERVRKSSSGSVEATFQSLLFGDGLSSSSSDTNPSHFALTDHDLAQGSGMEHATFRELSSTTGRWQSPDPYDGSYSIFDPQSFNRYAYVQNNPLVYNDPLGLQTGCVHSTLYMIDDKGVVHSTPVNPDPRCFDWDGLMWAGGSLGRPTWNSTDPISYGYSVVPAAPSKPSVGTCLGQAVSNGRGLALLTDVVGDIATGVALANPASTAAVVVGVAAQSVGTLNTLVHNPGWLDLSTSGANQTVTATSTVTRGLEIGSFIRTGTSFAKTLNGLGILGSVYSTLSDSSAAISAYTNCRNGKS